MEGEDSPSSGRFVSEERNVSREQAALAEMAYRLSSSNVVGDHEDDGSTRREAKLLMSLSAFPQSPNQSDLDLISSSESDSSYLSDSSRSTEAFTFVCPSLSLEHNRGSTLQQAYHKKRNLARKNEDQDLEQSLTPSKLLGRQLKADDREAVRLSADAMARNIYDSFRKALQWRINSWIEVLSKSIARKEKAMLDNGSTKEDLKVLLSSSEAKLILTLRSVEEDIKVTGTRTSFTVLPQRVDKDGEPIIKKRRVLGSASSSLEEGEYLYSVAHELRFECVVELNTPAGFSELTLEVPGSMDGTFLSLGFDQEQLTAVSVDIHTEMLATMIEKCCRKVVRASLECALNPRAVEPSMDGSHKTVTFAPPVQSTPKPSFVDRRLVNEFSTPPQVSASNTVSPEAVRAALVSPSRDLSIRSSPISQTRFLSPIPDDFDSFPSRRISPQPNDSGFHKTYPFTTPLTPKTPITGGATSVLVSPPTSTTNQNFVGHHTVLPTEKGPSLPMLVEVACRVFGDN